MNRQHRDERPAVALGGSPNSAEQRYQVQLRWAAATYLRARRQAIWAGAAAVALLLTCLLTYLMPTPPIPTWARLPFDVTVTPAVVLFIALAAQTSTAGAWLTSLRQLMAPPQLNTASTLRYARAVCARGPAVDLVQHALVTLWRIDEHTGPEQNDARQVLIEHNVPDVSKGDYVPVQARFP